jgi:hypothetical protein
MSRYHRDNVSRLEDIEGLLVTAQNLASRFQDEELKVTKDCISTLLGELRAAQLKLSAKWSEADKN